MMFGKLTPQVGPAILGMDTGVFLYNNLSTLLPKGYQMLLSAGGGGGTVKHHQ